MRRAVRVAQSRRAYDVVSRRVSQVGDTATSVQAHWMGLADFVEHFFERLSFGALVHVQIASELLDLRLVEERQIAVEYLVRFAVVVELGSMKLDQKSC